MNVRRAAKPGDVFVGEIDTENTGGKLQSTLMKYKNVLPDMSLSPEDTIQSETTSEPNLKSNEQNVHSPVRQVYNLDNLETITLTVPPPSTPRRLHDSPTGLQNVTEKQTQKSPHIHVAPTRFQNATEKLIQNPPHGMTTSPVKASQGPPSTNTPSQSTPSTFANESATASPWRGDVSRHLSEQKAIDRRGRDGDVVLIINYREGESPMSEILRLEGGQGMPVIVQAVAVGSKAARAGVVPGYGLVSMNGRKEFMQLPGWQIQLLLEAPITLGFDPVPAVTAKRITPCTEIRLKRNEDNIGVPPKVAVCGPREHGLLAEEVVFKPGSAPLFLKTSTSFPNPVAICQASEEPFVGESQDRKPGYIYELRARDAQALVGRAVQGARAMVGPTFDIPDIECDGDPEIPEFHRSWRKLSSVSCSLDCVAECVESQDDAFKQTGQTRKNVPLHRSIGQPALTAPEMDGVVALGASPRIHSGQVPQGGIHSTRNVVSFANRAEGSIAGAPAKAGRGRAPRSFAGGGDTGGLDEDEDNWMNMHSSKSPLRWLAPVLGPVVRAFSPPRSPAPTISPNSFTFSAPETTPKSTPWKTIRAVPNRAVGGASSPQTPVAQRTKARSDTATPVFSDTRGQYSPRGCRGKHISAAISKPPQVHDMPPANLSPLPSLNLSTAWEGNAPGVSCPTGPRSLSPRTRALVGDRSDAECDYNRPTRSCRSQATNVPSFSVSWTKDMLSREVPESLIEDDEVPFELA